MMTPSDDAVRHPMIMRLRGREDELRRILRRVIDFAALVPTAWREWEGRSGTWSHELRRDAGAGTPAGSIRASYAGPSLGTCTLHIHDDEGSIGLGMPMDGDRVDDDGPAMTAHVASAARLILDRMDMAPDLTPAANDDVDWMLTLAVVADRSDPAERGRTLQVWMPTPWSCLGASDVAGMDIEVDPSDRAIFEAHAPHGVLVGMRSDVLGASSIEIAPITGVVGETMPSTDDAMAVLRATSRAIAAGAVRPDGPVDRKTGEDPR